MEKLAHWTQNSTTDFIHSISSNFLAQIETKIEEDDISQNEIASKMNKTSGRVSQLLNSPGNSSIRVMVELARAVGMKISIVAYDDNDPNNDRGPIDPDVFRRCWEDADRPKNLFDVARVSTSVSADTFCPKAWDWGTGYQHESIGGAAVFDIESAMKKSGTFGKEAA